MRKKIIGMLLSILLLMNILTGSTETFGDLEARFANVPRLEYNGTTYYMNNRMTTVLVMCAAKRAEGIFEAPQLIALLIVDDDAKYVYPLLLDRATVQDWSDSDDVGLSVAESFSAGEDADASCLAMVELINGLFPESVIEHYVLFDVEGVSVLDGIENDTDNIGQDVLLDRMRAIKAQYDAMPLADSKSLFSELSDYIITDMKSGAMMKVIDKCDRYDRDHLSPLPANSDEDGKTYIDHVLLMEKIVEMYYNHEPLW